MFYLHSWLLHNRFVELQQANKSFRSLKGHSQESIGIKESCQLILRNDNVFIYSNEPDDLVLQELERARRVLWLQLENLALQGKLKTRF